MTLRQGLMLTCVLIFASGCVQTRDCDWAQPIRPTQSDISNVSDGLARDILAHNLTGQKLCGWQP